MTEVPDSVLSGVTFCRWIFASDVNIAIIAHLSVCENLDCRSPLLELTELLIVKHRRCLWAYSCHFGNIITLVGGCYF